MGEVPKKGVPNDSIQGKHAKSEEQPFFHLAVQQLEDREVKYSRRNTDQQQGSWLRAAIAASEELLSN